MVEVRDNAHFGVGGTAQRVSEAPGDRCRDLAIVSVSEFTKALTHLVSLFLSDRTKAELQDLERRNRLHHEGRLHRELQDQERERLHRERKNNLGKA